MATMTAVKSGAVEGEKTQFRTQMVNGRAQIYFDALDESPIKSKPRRNSRSINTTRVPEQAKPKPSSQKSLPQNFANKPTKKTNRVTFNDDSSTMGVFMTMDEISELVKTVKENTKAESNTTTDSKEPPPPPPPHPPPVQQQERTEVPVLKLDVPPPSAPISPRQEALGMMADKKRQKWMREKAEMDRMQLEVEYDQLKHQLSPVHQKAASSPERSTIPSDYSSTNNRPPLPPSTKPNDTTQNDLFKTRLMEKKQQQWKQENAEKTPLWNPFGRPGAGAPNTSEAQPKISQPSSNNTMIPYRPADTSSVPPTIVLNDQTHIPAAMRTNLLFGDVRFEDEVKTAKEIERRQWLDDLQKQIEENKRQKFTQQETERRQDFLHENLQPLLQEADHRHQQHKEPSPILQEADHRHRQHKEPSPIPSSNTLTSSHTGHDTTKMNRHDSVVQLTYDKILEATELAKYEKKAQLIEKLKRNGHKTDLLAKTLPDVKTVASPSPQKTNDKNYDSPPKKPTTTTKIEPLQLNLANDHHNDARRDEAVNTIDSTFRSDNSAQTDLRMPPHKQIFSFTREESDLPPQIPSHLLRGSKQTKKNVRIRSAEDQQRQHRSHSNPSTQDDGAPSQRSINPPVDLLHRPLWNYQNPQHREYIPNSKRDPHRDKRHRSQGNVRRIDDLQKKTSYNRWNSDGALQHEEKEKRMNPTNRPRPMGVKQQHPKEENMMNLFKGQKAKQQAFVITKTDDERSFNNISSLDKYEHFTPYIRTDEILDPSKAFSPVPQSRDTSAHRQRPITYDDSHRRQKTSVQPPPYHVPPSRQDHILQQLTAIKENLVRRQQEVTTSMNAIPV